MDQDPFTRYIGQLPHAFADGDADAAGRKREAENVRRVQEQYRALARGDFAAFREFLADNIDMEIVGPSSVPFVGRWRGRDAVVAALRQNFSWVEDQRPEIQSVVAQGERVVVIARERGRYRPTGRAYDLHWVQIFTFRDGRLARFREFFDSAAMLGVVRPPRGGGAGPDFL
jgi:uncharacterized protein